MIVHQFPDGLEDAVAKSCPKVSQRTVLQTVVVIRQAKIDPGVLHGSMAEERKIWNGWHYIFIIVDTEGTEQAILFHLLQVQIHGRLVQFGKARYLGRV